MDGHRELVARIGRAIDEAKASGDAPLALMLMASYAAAASAEAWRLHGDPGAGAAFDRLAVEVEESAYMVAADLRRKEEMIRALGDARAMLAGAVGGPQPN